MKSRHAARFISIGIALAATACGGGSGDGQTAAPPVMAIDGSSTVYPISEAVTETFRGQNPNVRITVSESGSGAGFQKFCRGETEISDASRPIRASEVETCLAAGITFIELPVAYDGLSVVIHPANTWARSMTVAELRKLWEPSAQGTVMRWNQIRPGWPDREIHLFGPGTASGTFDYFTEAIVGEARSSRGDYTASEDDNVLVTGVAGDEGALGYFGLAYYERNQDKLAIVAVDDENPDNGDGPIAPSFESVRTGTYRPLSRPLFIYVNVSALERPEVAEFVSFYLNTEPELFQTVGYVPLNATEAGLVRERFAARTTGSMFGEAPHTASLEDLLRAP